MRVGAEALGINYAILRLQNVFGEGQSLGNPYTGLLSIFSTKIRYGAEIDLYEDGLETRDFIHVSDVVEAFRLCVAASEPINDIINVGSGQQSSVHEVAKLLAKAFEVPDASRVTGHYRIGDIRHNFASTNRAREIIEFEPKISLMAGLQLFAAWVQTQPLPIDGLAAANSEMSALGLMGRGASK